ncbi:MAG: multiprotein-bridging factor 1 family protein [Halobacteriota archaeon]
MQCEICGLEIKGEAQYIKIGVSELRVCKSCARHGTVVVVAEAGRTAEVKGSEQPQQLARAKGKSRLYEQMDRDIEAGIENEEDYGRKIKEAREKAGLKQAELAKRINEKQSLLRKIENEEIIPGEGVRRKIERVLKPFLV